MIQQVPALVDIGAHAAADVIGSLENKSINPRSSQLLCAVEPRNSCSNNNDWSVCWVQRRNYRKMETNTHQGPPRGAAVSPRSSSFP
eukprot:6174898-Pleurochrysis_carterae.AAC.2